MGHKNMARVMLAQPGIRVPPMAWRCLLLMAMRAHDNEPLYWGGVGWLQLNLGYQTGPSGRRKVMRHIATLESAGYIVRTPKRVGHRVVYELRLPELLGPPSTGG